MHGFGAAWAPPRPFSAFTKEKGPAVLLAESQFCDDCAVTLDVLLIQVG
jgi:hypothetical protein